jgi:predicted AAA+ superfamily ATPase
MRYSDKIFFEGKALIKSTAGETDKLMCFVVMDSVTHLHNICENKKWPLKRLDSKLIVPHYRASVPIASSKKQKNQKMDGTGMWQFEVNGQPAIFARYLDGYGRNVEYHSMLIATYDVFKQYSNATQQQQKRMGKLKPGIFNAFLINGQLQLDPIKRLPNSEIFHQSAETVFASVTRFFENKERYLRFNKPGLKKLLLSGEPGTGKSSMLYKIANEYKKTSTVIFASSINCVAQAMMIAAKHSTPIIVFYEDCEADLNVPSSELRNFLDGATTPRNTAGQLLIMTTNNPDQIDPTIGARPGRIGEIIKIGALDAVSAVKCANYYMGQYGLVFDSMQDKLKNMTGDQIRSLSEMIEDFAIDRDEEISLQLVDDLIMKLKDQLTEMLRRSKNNAFESLNRKQKVGFQMQGH